MDCDRMEPLMSLFVDSDLREADQGMMFRHLEGCGDCRDLLESMIRLRKAAAVERDALFREAGEVLPSPDLILREARRAPRLRLPVWRRVLGGGMRMPVPVAIGIAIILLLAGIVVGARIPAGAGRGASPAVERVSRPAVVVVCGLPEVEVVGTGQRR